MSLTVTEKEYWIKRINQIIEDEKTRLLSTLSADTVQEAKAATQNQIINDLNIKEELDEFDNINETREALREYLTELDTAKDSLRHAIRNKFIAHGVTGHFSLYSLPSEYLISIVEKRYLLQLPKNKEVMRLLDLGELKQSLEDRIMLATSSNKLAEAIKPILSDLGVVL